MLWNPLILHIIRLLQPDNTIPQTVLLLAFQLASLIVRDTVTDALPHIVHMHGDVVLTIDLL